VKRKPLISILRTIIYSFVVLSICGCVDSCDNKGVLNVSVVGQGSVTPDGGIYDLGSTATVQANPSSGWMFDHWEGDPSGSSNPAVILMDGDKNVTAVFVVNTPSSNYTETIKVEESTASLSTSAQYYKVAELAQEQIKQANVPNVVEDKGNLLVLDITSWPEGWETGKIIVVRMPTGVIEYRRLMVRFQLDDSRLAIGAIPASFMEAFDNCEVTVEGDLSQTAQPAKALFRTAKIITPIDYDSDTTISIIDASSVSIYKADGVELQFTEIKLTATPHLKIKLVIDKPDTPLDVLGKLLADASQGISDFVDQSGDLLKDDPNGKVVLVSLSKAQTFIDGALATKNVADALQGILSVLCGKRRLKEAYAIVDGDIVGKVSFLASASSSYHREFEKELGTLLVPITGPIPIFLEFELLAVGSIDFDGQIQVTCGAEITVPFYAGMHVVNGEVQNLERPDLTPEFVFTPPTFDGTEAALQLAVGVQCRAGVSLATILSATADPTA